MATVFDFPGTALDTLSIRSRVASRNSVLQSLMHHLLLRHPGLTGDSAPAVGCLPSPIHPLPPFFFPSGTACKLLQE